MHNQVKGHTARIRLIDASSFLAERKKSMLQNSLSFTGPGSVEIREAQLPSPDGGQVLVQTLYSAISPGSELIIYRGLFPHNIPVYSRKS